MSKPTENMAVQRAAEWTETLKAANTRERAAFDEWLMESPRHVREFLLMTALDRELAQVDPQRQTDVAELLAQSAHNVISIKVPATPVRGRRHRILWAAAVAVVAVAALLVWNATRTDRWQHFTTAVGEQKALQLADGSVVHLNTRSELQVRLAKDARELRLVRGEALFKVERDTARPFRVQAGETWIRALGTQFDVYRKSDATTTVAVIEGKVEVRARTAAQLAAGETAKVAADGAVRKDTSADVDSAVAWRQRRLVFRQDTLADVIAEFNRYNREPQFRLEDPALAARHYSGEFDADDPESLIALLTLDEHLQVERQGHAIVLTRREP